MGETSGMASKPLQPAKIFVRWILKHLFWILTRSQISYLYFPTWTDGLSYSSDDDDDLDYTDDYESSPFDSYGTSDNSLPPLKGDFPEEAVNNFDPLPEIVHPLNVNSQPPVKHFLTNGSSPRPCDKRVFLYNLQPDRLNTSGIFNPLKGKLTNCHSSGCERPFSVQKIPHSNLILLVVDTLCPCGSKQLSITPQEVIWDGATCRRKPQESMYRRRPPKCINYHPEETEIHLCGRAYDLSVSFILLSTCLALFMTRIAGDLQWTS